MKKKSGFTLIELMAAIVIFGVLSAVVAPQIPGFTRKSREGKTKGNLAILRSTICIYYAETDGIYPTGSLPEALVPKYLKKMPVCNLSDTGHRPISSVGEVTFNDPPAVYLQGFTIGTWDSGGWCYCELVDGAPGAIDETPHFWGDLWIDCSHTDLSGFSWTSY
jgi:prepilin-type N-terminal cleavage/methylation domain-containing protein